jgi:hypothetical protein
MLLLFSIHEALTEVGRFCASVVKNTSHATSNANKSRFYLRRLHSYNKSMNFRNITLGLISTRITYFLPLVNSASDSEVSSGRIRTTPSALED